MSKSKKKGSAFEKDVVDYIKAALGDERIERRVLCGVNDRGDIAGVMFRGRRMVLECKNCTRMDLSGWLNEAEDERGNDDAEFAVVVHKRKGCGKSNMGKTYVTCTLENLVAMIAGARALLEIDQ